ncbi:hypothetical protein NL529_32240, partial [Klebsiella pneumoniae]|nr:hypothetical protein [Klebsiella pneumoniae]
DINQKYRPSKDETGIRLNACPTAWFNGYSQFYNEQVYQKPEEWSERQVIAWFKQYGKNYFSSLDIWDVDWADQSMSK